MSALFHLITSYFICIAVFDRFLFPFSGFLRQDFSVTRSHRDPPASAPQLLGLKMCATTARPDFLFKKMLKNILLFTYTHALVWVCTCTFKHHIFFLGRSYCVWGCGVCICACAMTCAWDPVTPCRGKGFSTHVGTEHQSEPSHWPPRVICSPVSEPWVPYHPVLWVMLLLARVSTDLLSVLRIYPEVGLLGHGVVLILVFEEPPHCFPEQLHHFVWHTWGVPVS